MDKGFNNMFNRYDGEMVTPTSSYSPAYYLGRYVPLVMYNRNSDDNTRNSSPILSITPTANSRKKNKKRKKKKTRKRETPIASDIKLEKNSEDLYGVSPATRVETLPRSGSLSQLLTYQHEKLPKTPTSNPPKDYSIPNFPTEIKSERPTPAITSVPKIQTEVCRNPTPPEYGSESAPKRRKRNESKLLEEKIKSNQFNTGQISKGLTSTIDTKLTLAQARGQANLDMPDGLEKNMKPPPAAIIQPRSPRSWPPILPPNIYNPARPKAAPQALSKLNENGKRIRREEAPSSSSLSVSEVPANDPSADVLDVQSQRNSVSKAVENDSALKDLLDPSSGKAAKRVKEKSVKIKKEKRTNIQYEAWPDGRTLQNPCIIRGSPLPEGSESHGEDEIAIRQSISNIKRKSQELDTVVNLKDCGSGNNLALTSDRVDVKGKGRAVDIRSIENDSRFSYVAYDQDDFRPNEGEVDDTGEGWAPDTQEESEDYRSIFCFEEVFNGYTDDEDDMTITALPIRRSDSSVNLCAGDNQPRRELSAGGETRPGITSQRVSQAGASHESNSRANDGSTEVSCTYELHAYFHQGPSLFNRTTGRSVSPLDGGISWNEFKSFNSTLPPQNRQNIFRYRADLDHVVRCKGHLGFNFSSAKNARRHRNRQSQTRNPSVINTGPALVSEQDESTPSQEHRRPQRLQTPFMSDEALKVRLQVIEDQKTTSMRMLNRERRKTEKELRRRKRSASVVNE